VQLSKQGYAYVLDRVTGEPIWPIEERRVPASDVPGERAWPTQPHPTKPPPYEYQGYVENDLIDFTPELRAEAIRIAKQYRLGPLFEPPSEIKENGTKGTWYNPGSTGGALWQGGGFDPENNYFYIPSKTGPSVITVANDPKSDMRFSRGPRPELSVEGLPILKPPYSRITALDLNTGEYAWVVPLGTTPQSVSKNPALAGITLPNTGGINLLATLLVTKTLLIAGEGWGGEPVVRAYDKKTGAVVAEVGIPGQMGSMPMTYMVNGQQYIAFTVGSPTEPAELVALALE
jgi:quinoprotein glucose dehydrogenase